MEHETLRTLSKQEMLCGLFAGCGKIMRGFVSVFDKLSDSSEATIYEVLKSLIKETHTSAEVYLTGHSLGGASAVVFAMLLSARQDALSSPTEVLQASIAFLPMP